MQVTFWRKNTGDQGYTTTIADMLLVCKETVTVWLNTFEEGGLNALCRMEAGGSDSYLTPEERKTLQAALGGVK